MATTLSLLITLSLLPIILPPTTAIPETTISSASEILSNTGYTSMSLTLPLLSSLLSLPSATLFSPPDSSFSSSSSGQPSLSLLQLHLSPRPYSPADLLSLPFGSHLPSLNPNSSLSVSSSDSDSPVSLNGLRVHLIPVFDDGFLVVYPVGGFFDPSFRPGSPATGPTPARPGTDCSVASEGRSDYWEASAALRTRGYTLMAGFLDLQVSQFDEENNGDQGKGRRVITVFAPRDEAMQGYFGNNSDWGTVFLRHVIRCEMSYEDLLGLDDRANLGTLLKGFGIKLGKNSDGKLVINGNVTVDFPDFYRSDRVLIHGLSGYLVDQSGNAGLSSGGRAYAPTSSKLVLEVAADHGEF